MQSETYKCSKCEQHKFASLFTKTRDPRSKRPVISWCKECCSIRGKEKYYENRSLKIESVNKRYAVLKRLAFSVLGDECTRCNEEDWDVLEIDHVYSDGFKEGKNRGGLKTLRKALDTPERYQLLCANCHARKTKREQTKKS